MIDFLRQVHKIIVIKIFLTALIENIFLVSTLNSQATNFVILYWLWSPTFMQV
jgi:hypothetical protein